MDSDVSMMVFGVLLCIALELLFLVLVGYTTLH
jgi:hypothetical protein